MKNKILHYLLTASIAVTAMPATSNATLVAPSLVDKLVSGARPATINCDMIEYFNTNTNTNQRISAVVYDSTNSGGGPMDSYLFIENTGATLGTTAKVKLPLADSKNPDVVIAYWNPTNAFIGVIYEWKGNIRLAVYDCNINALNANLTLQTDVTLSSGLPNSKPHIDMHSINGLYTNGFIGCIQYAAIWQQGSGPFYTMQGVYGDLPSATVTGNLQFALTYNNAVRNPDIACYSDYTVTPNKDYVAYIFEKSGGDLLVATQDKTAAGATGTVISSSSTYGTPRIEAQSQLLSSGAQWQAICPVLNGSFFEAVMYGSGIPNYTMSTGLSTTDNFTQVGIAGGVGGAGAGLGLNFFSQNYTAMAHPESGGITGNRAYDFNRTNGGAPAANYYGTNTTTFTIPAQLPLAVGSSSNSGNYLISAWWNPSASPAGIYFKWTASPIVFRPTGVAAVAGNSNIKLYPNPANDAITVEGIKEANYNVVDMAGRTMLTGWANGNTTISLSSLAAGNYILQLNEAGTISTRRFTKQ